MEFKYWLVLMTFFGNIIYNFFYLFYSKYKDRMKELNLIYNKNRVYINDSVIMDSNYRINSSWTDFFWLKFFTRLISSFLEDWGQYRADLYESYKIKSENEC